MLSDVVSPSSYKTFNVTLAHIIGLVNAVYCSELLDIYSKARRKNKLDESNFFIVNRDYVKTKTSIKVDEQYVCDVSLGKVGLITTSIENPDRIKFDVELFMQIIAEEDSKVLNQIYKKVNLITNKEEAKKIKKESIKKKLLDLISKDNVKIYDALVDWLNAIFDGGKYVVKETIEDFQSTLFAYVKSDVNKALRIIAIAKAQGWTNCLYAIESYEKEQKVLDMRVRTTSIKVASNDNLSDKRY